MIERIFEIDIKMCDKNQPGKWTHSKRQLKHSHPLFEEGNILCSILVKQLPFDASAPEEFSDPRFVPVSKNHTQIPCICISKKNLTLES